MRLKKNTLEHIWSYQFETLSVFCLSVLWWQKRFPAFIEHIMSSSSQGLPKMNCITGMFSSIIREIILTNSVVYFHYCFMLYLGHHAFYFCFCFWDSLECLCAKLDVQIANLKRCAIWFGVLKWKSQWHLVGIGLYEIEIVLICFLFYFSF